MSLAEGVSGRITYKAYASGLITSNAQAVSGTDLGASGGQILRRVSSSLKLGKDTYQSAEARSDRQIADFRHGIKRVTGSVTGEFSPGTYFELFEAAFRATKGAALSLSNTDFTDVVSGPTGFTFSSGDPVASGLRVGGFMRFAGLAATANNAKNFFITGFSGTSNRIVGVFPVPATDAVADSSFTLTTNGATGKSLSIPSSGHVSRKFGFEVYNSDVDIYRLFTECRIAGFNINLPATGMATVEFPVMGRDMEADVAGAAPFFTSPTAETGTGIFAAVNGLLRVSGATVGVVTGLQIQMNLNPSAPAVVGQNFVPEIFLGRANVTGQVTACFEDLTLINDFKNETEIDILAYLTTSIAANAPSVGIYLPRVKFGDASVADQGEAEQAITLPFQALKYTGSAAGIVGSTIYMTDSEAV